MYKSVIITLVCLLFSSVLMAQETYDSSIGIISDNDAYANPYQDQYYSSGLSISYRYLSPSTSDNYLKKIYHTSISQNIYMPSQDYKSLSIRHDRPYAGYLFTDLSIEKYRKKSMMKWGLQLGVLGPASQGQKMQEFIHQVFNLEENKGWEHQIQNQIGVNLEFWYLKSIFYGFNKQFDLNVFGGGQIGTIFNRADLGFVTRVGFGSLNPIFNSILLKSNLNKAPEDSSNNEVFLFIKPKLSYVIYDATISASLFNDDSSVSFASMPWQTSIEIGLNISQGRFDIAYSVFFLSKKPDNNLASSHEFGRLELIYRFN